MALPGVVILALTIIALGIIAVYAAALGGVYSAASTRRRCIAMLTVGLPREPSIRPCSLPPSAPRPVNGTNQRA